MFTSSLLTLMMIFLLKPLTQQQLSKELIEQLIDALLNLLIAFPTDEVTKNMVFEILIVILSEIEPQMAEKITSANAINEDVFRDKILHKVQYKQIPFIDYKKSMIILSNGDPIKLIDNVF